VPPDLRSQPEYIRQEIADNRAAIVSERQVVNAQMQSWAGSMHNELADAQRTLVLAEPFVQLDTAMRSAGSLSAVTGWVPEDDLPKLEETLNQQLSNPFLLTTRNPHHNERTDVPTVMMRNRFLSPFQDLICQYGVPRYGETDPTIIFSFTFILMFGAMFGDIGQGGIVVLLGWLFRSQLKHFSQFIIYLGLSSVTFGFLYGSLFGFEHVIPHLWIAPITDPIYMLTVALIFGVVFVTTMSLVSIYNHVMMDETAEAIFGHHGVASLILYLSALGGLYQLIQTGEFGWIATFLAIAAFTAIFGFSWLHMKDASFGEKFLVGVIGGMEIIMGYVSNTLSFLRVAAFSLNHAALALAVFAIANMMQSTGYWVTVVIGNIFVMVLEGAIVTIQTMRLEYYEGFSRYYFGDGREYVPLKLRAAVAK
jgi:V/A-type H+-transporting ATPase subunit I